MVLFQTQFGSLWKKPAECERPRQHGSGLSKKGQEYGRRKNVNSRNSLDLGMWTQTHVTTVAHLDIGRKTGGPGGDANYSSNSGFHKGKAKAR